MGPGDDPTKAPVPTAAGLFDWRAELQRLGGQVVVAVARFLALLLFIGMHLVLSWVTTLVLPPEWTKAKSLLKGFFAIVFIFVYVEQAIEMLAIFYPRFQVLRNRITRGDSRGEGVQ